MIILMLLSVFNFEHLYYGEHLLVLDVEVSGQFILRGVNWPGLRP